MDGKVATIFAESAVLDEGLVNGRLRPADFDSSAEVQIDGGSWAMALQGMSWRMETTSVTISHSNEPDLSSSIRTVPVQSRRLVVPSISKELDTLAISDRKDGSLSLLRQQAQHLSQHDLIHASPLASLSQFIYR